MPTVDVLRPAKPACFGAEVESSGLISCPAGARRGGEVLSGGGGKLQQMCLCCVCWCWMIWDGLKITVQQRCPPGGFRVIADHAASAASGWECSESRW